MNNIITKVCRVCGVEKPLKDFRKNRKWYVSKCKKCEAEYAKRYREKNPGYQKLWEALNPQKVLDKFRRYRERHREELRERDRIYGQAHPEKIAERNRKHYQNNKERVDAYRAEYRKQKPDIKKAIDQKRRAAKKNGGSFTAQEWADLKKKYNHTCLRCHRSEPEIKLTPDHVLPLSKGGTNDISNIQPLCYSCNSRKYNKHIDYR